MRDEPLTSLPRVGRGPRGVRLRSPLLHFRRWLPLVLVGFVAARTYSYRYTDSASVPRERVALVFGAGVRPDGRLTRMLSDRVSAAIELYKQGRVEKLLMTGDNSSATYDEVTAMQNFALARGVPADDITLDYAGFSTYES